MKQRTMRRIGNLYERIISIDNLVLADEKARKGKTSSYGVKVHDMNRKENIKSLHETLKRGEFKTSRYDIFTIHEPKEREIYRLPYYPDRIVHHAVMNVLESIWVECFTKDTYSCIKGRGIQGCMEAVDDALKDCDGTKYCLKIDIRKYYPSIDHDILKAIVRRKIKCPKTLALLDEIIDSADGVPIGNYLSQYFANLYLSYFDHWVKEVLGIKYYFRYADDMVFLSPSKEHLHSVFIKVRNYLENELKLKVKDNWQVFPVAENREDKSGRGLDFVGFVFYHNQKLIRKGIKKNFCRTCARLNKRSVSNADYKKRISSWLGWAKHSDSKHLLKVIVKDGLL